MQDFSLAVSHSAFLEWPFYLAFAAWSTMFQKLDISHLLDVLFELAREG